MNLRVIEPRHFRYLGEQNDDHLNDLLVQICLLLDQKVYHEVLDAQFLLDGDFQPISRKELLQGRHCNEFGVLKG